MVNQMQLAHSLDICIRTLNESGALAITASSSGPGCCRWCIRIDAGGDRSTCATASAASRDSSASRRLPAVKKTTRVRAMQHAPSSSAAKRQKRVSPSCASKILCSQALSSGQGDRRVHGRRERRCRLCMLVVQEEGAGELGRHTINRGLAGRKSRRSSGREERRRTRRASETLAPLCTRLHTTTGWVSKQPGALGFTTANACRDCERW